MVTGLYREVRGWAGVEDSACVIDSAGYKYNVPRSRYEGQGYAPPFDELPTKEEYEAKN